VVWLFSTANWFYGILPQGFGRFWNPTITHILNYTPKIFPNPSSKFLILSNTIFTYAIVCPRGEVCEGLRRLFGFGVLEFFFSTQKAK
jgi:hypothetical protein